MLTLLFRQQQSRGKTEAEKEANKMLVCLVDRIGNNTVKITTLLKWCWLTPE